MDLVSITVNRLSRYRRLLGWVGSWYLKWIFLFFFALHLYYIDYRNTSKWQNDIAMVEYTIHVTDLFRYVRSVESNLIYPSPWIKP